MTFDEFKTVCMPTHEVIEYDLDGNRTLNKAKATIAFSSSHAYEMRLDNPDTAKRTIAGEYVTYMLYDCVCKAFSNSLIVERMIFRAYEYGLKDGSTNCFSRDRADILKAVGFDEQ